MDDPETPWYKIFHIVKPGSRILDIGCSSGTLGSVLIKEKNCEVVGIDLNADDIEIAKKKLTAAYVMNIETNDIDHLGTFDYVVFADVIEHLTDPVRTLKRAGLLLNKTGTLVFSIPNMAHMGVRLMLLEGKFTYAETGLLDKTHIHFYDRDEIERVFLEAGFELKVMDWCERYIPSKILADRLKFLGLTPDETFLNKNKEIDALAYQYIGQAKPTFNKTKHNKLGFVSPYVPVVEDQIKELEDTYGHEIAQLNNIHKQKITKFENEMHALLTSKSWKITKPLRVANRVIKFIMYQKDIMKLTVQKDPRFHPADRIPLKEAVTSYSINDNAFKDIKRGGDVGTAVVIHLYYTEAWDVISSKIKILESRIKYDLFITLPFAEKKFENIIRKSYPSANIFFVPNRGRDVLPFIKIAQHLKGMGYVSVLKIHSKKSPHRKDGGEWFNQIVDSLIPNNNIIYNDLVNKLHNKKTGLIGPSGQYISLKVNFHANAYLMLKILKTVHTKNTSRDIERNRGEYGFFAGTMFWARLDALEKLLNYNFGPYHFESEKGTIDATMAHALERAFCVCAEIEERDMFEINDQGIAQIAYKTDNIPEWSDLHPNYKKPNALS